MFEALTFWALAMYGAIVLVWQVTRRIRNPSRPPHPLLLALMVADAEDQIEGILRLLIMRTAYGQRERRIWVVDESSGDETERIVRRMMVQYPCLDYLRVMDDETGVRELVHRCLETTGVGCIYDLRVNGMLQDVTMDILRLCR